MCSASRPPVCLVAFAVASAFVSFVSFVSSVSRANASNFVSSGATFTNYLKQQQEKGIKTFWFVTEHSRTSSLKNEASNPKVFEMVTDKKLNNKFCLVKAVYD